MQRMILNLETHTEISYTEVANILLVNRITLSKIHKKYNRSGVIEDDKRGVSRTLYMSDDIIYIDEIGFNHDLMAKFGRSLDKREKSFSGYDKLKGTQHKCVCRKAKQWLFISGQELEHTA
ncbi:hypothetical protein RF11_11699 [Thelohanellus kitauei]|uniref:Uncharacterized protein n=1 Tax=Thelohanellus kitauei TaxID=669202 RepID=A0A0C2MDW7_THEKT|nr:hypothetical protein RF11_11699 [Thelohanellus kitauei]